MGRNQLLSDQTRESKLKPQKLLPAKISDNEVYRP